MSKLVLAKKSSSKSKPVKYFTCPKDDFSSSRLDINGNKRNRSKDKSGNTPSSDNNATEKPEFDLSAGYKSIKSYSSIALKGISRIKHKDDVLTKLGVPPAKDQYMPQKVSVCVSDVGVGVNVGMCVCLFL